MLDHCLVKALLIWPTSQENLLKSNVISTYFFEKFNR